MRLYATTDQRPILEVMIPYRPLVRFDEYHVMLDRTNSCYDAGAAGDRQCLDFALFLLCKMLRKDGHDPDLAHWRAERELDAQGTWTGGITFFARCFHRETSH